MMAPVLRRYVLQTTGPLQPKGRFTVWLAGCGVKGGGYTYGAADEFGFSAVENPVTSTTFTRRCFIFWDLTTKS